MLEPGWPVPPRVRALVTTRDMGDMALEEGRRALRAHLPAEPRWLRQVHGNQVSSDAEVLDTADATVTRARNTPQAVMIADCMPVFFADEDASVVGVAHAGWRGLAAGVLEATVDAMRVPAGRLITWLGPAIGPRAYEVGKDVHGALPAHQAAFVVNRPGHWLLDLYSVARARLQARGVQRIRGGGFCTYSETERFFSYRRERAAGRMAAVIWLA
ncbi:MAG: peptidoglycan editing factor PgeF [Betaproteobacteria bacterium]